MINDLELDDLDDPDFDTNRSELSELWRDLERNGRIPSDDSFRDY
jgi:hypothetical protein